MRWSVTAVGLRLWSRYFSKTNGTSAGTSATGTNPRYLRDVRFDPGSLHLSDSLDEVARDAEIVVLAAPSVYLKTTLEPLTEPLGDKFIVSAIKGIVPDDLITVAEYVNRRYDLTVVCKTLENSRILGDKIRTDYINVGHSTDIYGIEYASVLKNIYAIAVGIAVGLGYGDNFLAVLISNGAMEMSRFMSQTYPSNRNTFASAYLGDLLVTSYSQFSRNRRFGLMIGKGYSVHSAQMEMSMVAEGYYAAECIMKINRQRGVDMPIARMVYDVLYDGASPSVSVGRLTGRLL